MTDILINILLLNMKSVDQQHECHPELSRNSECQAQPQNWKWHFVKTPPGESHTPESLGSTPLDDSDKIHELHFKKCSSVAE